MPFGLHSTPVDNTLPVLTVCSPVVCSPPRAAQRGAGRHFLDVNTQRASRTRRSGARRRTRLRQHEHQVELYPANFYTLAPRSRSLGRLRSPLQVFGKSLDNASHQVCGRGGRVSLVRLYWSYWSAAYRGVHLVLVFTSYWFHWEVMGYWVYNF